MEINLEILKPLPKKEITYTDFVKDNHPKKILVYERVLFFDPIELYKKVSDKLDPNKRHQKIQMDDLFPKKEEVKCACGCDAIPKSGEGWHVKWATDECAGFAGDVLSIMNNYFGRPAYYISLYYGKKCTECEGTSDLELDHIIGVKHGGGVCWLSNYVWRCKKCHTKKTNKDFNKGEYKNPEQLKLI